MKNISPRDAAAFGFIFPQARGWLGDKRAVARDAALVTTPNTMVPAEFLAYIDPQVVEILTAPRNARLIFDESKKGDWVTAYSKWRMDEVVGSTQPYSDYANGTTSDVNSNWATREQYVFQTSIKYGMMEIARSSEAKQDLAAAKQRAAAVILDIDANKFALNGVAGKEIYGILNDPNLPAAITAAATGTGQATQWNTKTTKAIYDDILSLFAELQQNSNGLITQNDRLKLCVSPWVSKSLGAATDFNVSVLDMAKHYMPNLEIVVLPELHTVQAGETVLLVADEVAGQKTGWLGFGVKLMSGPIVQEASSFHQKWWSSTYGGVVTQPFAVASMTGI